MSEPQALNFPRCLAIITARAGSKGVKNKNMRMLAGKPTIAYTIQVGLECPYIDKVLLTTDSQELRDLALELGAESPFLRPEHLATDSARQEDAILHAMTWCEQAEEQFDWMCLLEPTCPLRTVNTLNRGFELLMSRADADAVFSITEAPISPVYCNTLRSDGTLKEFIPKQYIWSNRQEIPDFYKLASLVTIARWDSYKREETFLLDNTLALLVDPVEAIDIDEPIDFFLAEKLLQEGLVNSRLLSACVNA
jgi:CMP-N,N'-diacetyllegionaminic acid synthase